MLSLLALLHLLIRLYVYILIASAVLSWLLAFNVINPHNPFVRSVGEFIWRITEPVLAPIRRMLPNLGGIDISPVILVIGLFFIDSLIYEYLG
jgi:YggT family protein